MFPPSNRQDRGRSVPAHRGSLPASSPHLATSAEPSRPGPGRGRPPQEGQQLPAAWVRCPGPSWEAEGKGAQGVPGVGGRRSGGRGGRGGVRWKRKRARPAAHFSVAPGSHRFAKKREPSRPSSWPGAAAPRGRGCCGEAESSGRGTRALGAPPPYTSPPGRAGPSPPTSRPASRTSIPRPLPRPRARGSGRAQAREPRCAWAPAGRRPQAASGGRRGPAGVGSPGTRLRDPASEPRPPPAAGPAASLAEAGQVRAAAPASEAPGRVGSATQWRALLTAPGLARPVNKRF